MKNDLVNKSGDLVKDLVNDCISRAAAIEAMRKAKDKSELHRMLIQLPSAQLAQDLTNGCTDTISRQAAVDALDKVAQMFPYRIPGDAKTYRQYNEAWNDATDAAETAIEALPPAQPDVSDINVGKICEYYDLCRNGRDEKKLREELLSAQPECEDCIKHGGNICPPCPKVPEREDAVSRAAVINAWRNACNSVMSKCACHYDDDIKDTVYDNTSEVNAVLRCNKEFKNALKALPLITLKQPGWIPCTPETMPQEDGEYLVTIHWESGGCYTDLLVYKAYWKEWKDEDRIFGTVIAWQPKPKPWEGGQDGET